MKTKFFMFRVLMILALFIASVTNTVAQVSNFKAYTLFIYNFTKYVQWPDGAIKDEFIIGVFGKSPIADELQKMGTIKKVGDKSIRIIELSESTLNSDIHILFIPEDKTTQISTIMTAVKGRPVLLVAEKEGTVQKGAAISFMSDHNNLKFEMNSASIASQNLKVSKTLEALAFKSPG